MKLVVRKFEWTLFCGAFRAGQKVGPSAMHQCFGGTSHQSVQIAIHKPKIRCHRDQQRFLAVGTLWLRKNTLMSTSKMFYTGNLEVLKFSASGKSEVVKFQYTTTNTDLPPKLKVQWPGNISIREENGLTNQAASNSLICTMQRDPATSPASKRLAP